MKIRNFKEDYENSIKLNDEWTKIFKRAFGEDIKVDFRNDKASQMGFGVDAVITTKKGRRYSVEHKTRRNDYLGYEEYLLEIKHHQYTDETRQHLIKSEPGWLYKGTFDYIFFGTLNQTGNKILEVLGFSSVPFKLEEFKSEYNSLKNGWANTKFDNGIFQLTLNKRATREFIHNNAIKSWYWREENENWEL